MRILYDNQVFTFQRFGGISRYFVELMRNLRPPFEPILPLTLTENVYLPGYHGPQSNIRGKKRLYGIINRWTSRRNLRGNYAIFHPTYYSPYFLQELKSPYVITVYDMIHEKFREMFSPKDLTIQYKKEVITRADKIIAISQNTKKDIVEIYGLPENRIDVVHLGHSITSHDISPVESLPDNYILFVGQRGGYKNFDRIVKAFAEIQKTFPEIYLICTGSIFTAEEKGLFKKLGINARVKHYFVSDKQLNYLYQQALCFVYPSLYEGFGIPILESFAANCPLALSNASCFPEIAREGGAYFDPYEPGSIYDILKKIITNNEYRNNLVENGKKVLSSYSWEKMAKETETVYRSVLS